MILKNCIEKLIQKKDLDALSCEAAIHEMLKPDVNPLHVTAFLVLLRSKPETVAELLGMMTALQQKMLTLPTQHKVLDIVGTGGDGFSTINISTGSAILAASCGIKIAKHGNRAVSSLAGSADVIEALGISIDLTPEKISTCINEIGIGFCFAPHFHPVMNHLRRLRNALKLPTPLNMIGPLLNPAKPAHLLLGVYDQALLPIVANALQQEGTLHSMVVHGKGLDEISCVGPATIFEINKKTITESIIDPQKLGFNYCKIENLQGGNAASNAEVLLKIYSGQCSTNQQAIADSLVLNAAVALYLYGRHASIEEAIRHAKENLAAGCALTLLKNWIAFSHD